MSSLTPSASLQLFVTAGELWARGVRPWVEAGRGRLEQSYIVLPTRGQVQGLKQRCVEDGLPLLGIEFLTPGLARRKWLAARAEPPRSAMGRELLLLGLRRLIAERLSAADQGTESWGYWQSLQSDAERVLDDWDTLLRSGHSAADFKSPALQDLFADLDKWIESSGYQHAAKQDRLLSLPVDQKLTRLADRVLVAGLGPEMGGEFYAVAGLVRRSGSAEVWLPEPDFSGGTVRVQEQWVERWQQMLGVETQPSSDDDPELGMERVSDLWARDLETLPDLQAVDLDVGETRGDEMKQVAARVGGWLQGGATRVGVVVPMSNAGHQQLRLELAAADIPFVDLLEVNGPPPLDVRLQAAILRYHAEGARIEDLMELWPRLLASGATTLSQRKLRSIVERSFVECHRHEVAAHISLWPRGETELVRVVEALGEAWPREITLAKAVDHFRTACERLDVGDTEGIQTLDTLGLTDQSEFPRAVIAEGISSILPDKINAQDGVKALGFARVVIGSWRRLVGTEWTHLIWTQSNATVWPMAPMESPWWPEADRINLREKLGSDAGLMTAADQREVEQVGWRRLVRDTKNVVAFSAARFEESTPETLLAPNGWLERLLMAKGWVTKAGGVAEAMEQISQARVMTPIESDDVGAWLRIDQDRRDPARKFNAWFHGSQQELLKPKRVSPRLIERGVQDPAELWYEGVLGARRIDRDALQRERSRALGLKAHELVAYALQPDQEVSAGFGPMPVQKQAQDKLSTAFEEWRSKQEKDRYWRSFSDELEAISKGLIDNLFTIDAGEFVATEMWLRDGAVLELPKHKIPLIGRMDLVRSDRPEWLGASIDIVDFKTGGDIAMSARKMGASGRSLQLGIYLQAAINAGAKSGRVWMVKSGEGELSVLGHEELDTALAQLAWLDEALTQGTYGALTGDRSAYSMADYDWPRACRPISEVILKRKFDLTFESEREDGNA